MRLDRCCISRLQSAGELFQPGQAIPAAVLSADDTLGQITLTGRELLGTWEENAGNFRQGQAVTGTVRSVMPYGIFGIGTQLFRTCRTDAGNSSRGRRQCVSPCHSPGKAQGEAEYSGKTARSPALISPGILYYLRAYRTVGVLPRQQSRYLFLMLSQYCFADCSSLLGPYS